MRTPSESPDPPPALSLEVREVAGEHEPEAVFATLFGAAPHAFWLDSARVGENARFSFMGAPGPHGAVVTYEVGGGEGGGELTIRRGEAVEVRSESIFDYIARVQRELVLPADDLPFDFNCGLVGYLGYELKGECGGEPAHRARTPDAAFVLADRLVAIDHQEARTYLLCLAEDADEAADAWLAETAAALSPKPRSARGVSEFEPPLRGRNLRHPPGLGLARSRERYLEDIAECDRALRAGESYEICLTNRIDAPGARDPLETYRALRRANPAPYAAFLRFGETAVLSSSPERFLRVGRNGVAEARPIKGTAPRSADPAEDARLARELQADEKSRAENVTIVDLLRNDLGRVCEFGSVEVTGLAELESYETVHQLVSTIRGRLRPEVGAAECARACFPPGSMTGAPKLRTMEILDRLEGEARGVYSGAIGWFGLGGGCDLSVAIRTIVLDGESASVGAGGAIVVDSDPEREYEEMLLKAMAPLRALDPELPADYRRIRLSASTPRVTPRKSTSSEAFSTKPG